MVKLFFFEKTSAVIYTVNDVSNINQLTQEENTATQNKFDLSVSINIQNVH